MQKAQSLHFFATKRDLELLLMGVESHRPLKYTEAGMFDSEDVATYATGVQIPNLGLAPSGDHNLERFWLITDVRTNIRTDVVPQRRGGVRYGIDPGLNPESVVIWPGGVCIAPVERLGRVYDGRAVIAGQIATAMMNSTSLELMNLFAREIRRRFKRIKSFFVGPEAEQLMDAGYRLTTSVQSPREVDLSKA